ILSMIVLSSYNIVDAIFIGRLGPEALAALAIAFPLMMVFIAIALGTGVGAASLISRRLGAEDYEGADRVASVTISLSILIGVLMTVITLPNMEALLRLFGASGPILSLARSYMSILATFAIVNVFSVVIGNIVRAEGNPILASVAMIVAALVNIALDPVLIFGLGPIPAMGVAGAAIATVIGRGIGGLILIIYLFSGKTSYHFRLNYFLPKLKILTEIYRVGVASMIRMTAGSVTLVLANRIAASFGVIPIAVLGVLFRSVSFIFMPCVGIGQGILPLIGYNFGAKQNERIGEVVSKAGLVSFIWSTLCLAVALLFPTQVISIFNTETQFLVEGIRALRIFSLAFFGVGIQIILSFFFQGIGKGFPALILASARQIIFLLPSLLILPSILGLTGLWVAYPVTDVLALVLTLVWTSIEFHRLGMRFRLRYS
ncbi:MATE family efflux transporter, partial [Chloroflexota bacterium]